MIARVYWPDDSIEPAELSMLQITLEELCRQERIARRSAAADELARQIVQIYKAGARDQGMILAAYQAGRSATRGTRVAALRPDMLQLNAVGERSDARQRLPTPERRKDAL